MKTALRVTSLFVAYSLLGFGGDYVAGLLADDDARVRVERESEVEVEREVEVEAEREIEVEVLVRTGGECAFAVDRELTIPVSAGDLLEIEAGAGSLSVEGREGLTRVVVVGRACASHEELVDELRLAVERDGGEITLSALYPSRRGFGGRTVARIDLTVAVPMGLDVDIEDSSGDIEVRGVGSLDIDDSSGNITVAGATGRVDIEDSSGSVDVVGVAGDVHVEDGSSSVRIQGVAGNVDVEDGSGGVEVSDVAGDVRIEDGSGGIEVRSIAGDFVVERDGGGGITYSGVAGRVDIPVRRRGR